MGKGDSAGAAVIGTDTGAVLAGQDLMPGGGSGNDISCGGAGNNTYAVASPSYRNFSNSLALTEQARAFPYMHALGAKRDMREIA